MSEDREQLLEHYRQTRTELLSAIEGVSETLLTEMKDDELLRFVALDISRATADD